MTSKEAQQYADDAGLGTIEFVTKYALNTGNLMTVGYVVKDRHRVLFCKSSTLRDRGSPFYLCNEFRALDGTE